MDSELVSLPHGLDELFAGYRREADLEALHNEKHEDERFGPLLTSGCRCLVKEYDWPKQLSVLIDDFPGGVTTKPLHTRVRLIFHDHHDRETHYSFRAIERTNAQAFQSRLKGVMNGSGVDPRLPFRHALILRTRPIPNGEITGKLWTQYTERGGKHHALTDDELRTLWALNRFVQQRPDGWEDWLQARRPASELAFFRSLATEIRNCLDGDVPPKAESKIPARPQVTSTEGITVEKKSELPKVENTPPPQKPYISPVSPVGDVHLGMHRIGAKSEPVRMPFPLLEKHTVVMAGAGSGKTVLLKHLVEEAALAGIPSIVLDAGNDLMELSLRRTKTPPEWRTEDPQRAARFHRDVEIVPWTPGRDAGNPLTFEPLPDLTSVSDDPEELRLTIDAAVDAIAGWAIGDRGAKAENKRAILSSALRFFAGQGGGALPDFIEILGALPARSRPEHSTRRETCAQMADALRAKLENDPLLRRLGNRPRSSDPLRRFNEDRKQNPCLSHQFHRAAWPCDSPAIRLSTRDDALLLDQKTSEAAGTCIARPTDRRRSQGIDTCAEVQSLENRSAVTRRTSPQIPSRLGAGNTKSARDREHGDRKLRNAFLWSRLVDGGFREHPRPTPSPRRTRR
ncbi:MAG: hypothetical protein QM811_19890 [Pirellulales bacterium]